MIYKIRQVLIRERLFDDEFSATSVFGIWSPKEAYNFMFTPKSAAWYNNVQADKEDNLLGIFELIKRRKKK